MAWTKYQPIFWLAVLTFFMLFLWGLQDVLLPFILGMAIAYFLDPVVDKVEDCGAGRALATTAVLSGFVIVFAGALAFLLPLFKVQLENMVQNVPVYIDQLRNQALPWVQESYGHMLPQGGLENWQEKYNDKIMGWTTAMVKTIWNSGFAIFDLLSVLVITPVVAFYMLRDWDHMIEKIDKWLPRDHQKTIHNILVQIDEALAGFVRGQASVCILLGAFYSIGLAVVGLNNGVTIGMVAGLISFIPYVGSIVGLVMAMGTAYFQYGLGDLTSMGLVGLVFVIGQFLEGNVLTPKMVGEKIGLHAVWVLFALMAGGSLLGFVGVMIAVPVAAVIGVMVRFTMEVYLKSGYFLGKEKDAKSAKAVKKKAPAKKKTAKTTKTKKA